MDDQLILKNRLKEIRAEKKLSQTDLAEMVNDGSVNTKSIAKEISKYFTYRFIRTIHLQSNIREF